jgi:hypothetical protein
VIGLAAFVTANHDAILAEWETFARTRGAVGGAMDAAALRDHAAAILTTIAADLRTPRRPGAQADQGPPPTERLAARDASDAPTAAGEHGAARAASGFTVEQTVSASRALRTSVVRLWTAANAGGVDRAPLALRASSLSDLTRFHDAVDAALADSVARHRGHRHRHRARGHAVHARARRSRARARDQPAARAPDRGRRHGSERARHGLDVLPVAPGGPRRLGSRACRRARRAGRLAEPRRRPHTGAPRCGRRTDGPGGRRHHRRRAPRGGRRDARRARANVHAYVARLRTDPGTPSAHAVDEAQIEDHVASFIGNLAATLPSFGEAAVAAASGDEAGDAAADVGDGTAIQRVVAERHGAQRARLGWSEAELRREYTILREELTAAVQRRAARDHPGPTPDAARRHAARAVAVPAQFLALAERLSLAAHRGVVAARARRACVRELPRREPRRVASGPPRATEPADALGGGARRDRARVRRRSRHGTRRGREAGAGRTRHSPPP